MKTSNTQKKPLKPAEENKDADEDTESEDEGIAKRTRSNRATVGALHVYKPMIAPPDMSYKISIINTAWNQPYNAFQQERDSNLSWNYIHKEVEV